MGIRSFLVCSFLGMLFFVPYSVFAANPPVVFLESNYSSVAPESLLEVKVLVSSEQKLNAFDIKLEYSSELFSFERAYTGDSVASLWQSLPFTDGDGTISLVGGSFYPWSGQRKEIITLIFKARRAGVSSFAVKKADFALSDGLGTKIQSLSNNQKIAVVETAPVVASKIPFNKPQISDISIIDDTTTSEPLIILDTPDAGSIKWLVMRSKNWIFWSDWQKVQLISSIPKSAWEAQLKAIGYNGEEIVQSFFRWKVALIKFSLIFALIVFLILILRFLRKRKLRMSKSGISLFLFFLFSSFYFIPTFCQAASLSLSPSSGTFNVGSTFDVQVLLDTEEQEINALDVRISFPPDILQVVSPTAGQSIIGIWTSPPRFDNQQGEIVLQGGIPKGINVSRGLISKITFRARQTGSAALKFNSASKILLNDGKGTNSLGQIQNAVLQFVLPPPAGPIVASETHPNQNLWYSIPQVLLNWENIVSASGYSFVLNDSPISIPDNTVDSKENYVAYDNLESGSHYFHIKALGESGFWGGTTHFAVNVDTEPPAKFPIEIKPAKRTISKTIFLYFNTTDKNSGVDRYEYSIIPLSSNSIKNAEAYQQFFVETNSPEIVELERGSYDVIVKAYDKSGNVQESKERVRVMSSVAFVLTSKWTLAIIILLVIVGFFVHKRIHKWHLEIENSNHKSKLPKNVKEQIEELKKYRKKYGTLAIFILLIFGTFLANPVFAEEINVLDLPPPLITTVSRNIYNTDIFYIGGRTEKPNVDVNIFLQNVNTRETRSFKVTSDRNGNWFYRHPTFVSAGDYILWAVSSVEETESPPSSQVTMRVSSNAVQFGGNRVSFETIYLFVIIILSILLAILLVLIFTKVRKARDRNKILIKEAKEAEEAVKRGFAILRKDLEAELTTLKAKFGQGASSEEEKQRGEQLMKDLMDMERYIGKEVWDIGKYLN